MDTNTNINNHHHQEEEEKVVVVEKSQSKPSKVSTLVFLRI